MAFYIGKSAFNKSGAAGDKAPRTFHPLFCHLQDVLNTGREMWRVNAFAIRSLPARLEMSEVMFLSLWEFGLRIHDVGKMAAPWQRMARGEGQNVSHVGFGVAFIAREYGHAVRGLRKLLHPFLAHHGHFEIATGDHEQFGTQQRQDARSLVERALQESGLDLRALESWYQSHAKLWVQFSWDLAAFVVIADWLGSMREFFPFAGTVMDREAYVRLSKERAAEAIRALPLSSESYPAAKVQLLFPFIRKLTHLQERLSSLPLTEGARLILCEELTGSGKTEAALLYASRLLSAGRARRIIFALPSQATSNAIYDRLKTVYRSFFLADNPTLMLTHGARAVKYEFVNSYELPEERSASLNTARSASFCNPFLASHPQLSLLADVTVGTLDQVLLALLMGVKHQSLRLLGLRDAVLIVDEVHSYDRYTGFLLQKLVSLHASRGGTVIALSATLTSEVRQALCRSFLEGLTQQDNVSRGKSVSLPACLATEPLSVPLPCLTYLDATGPGNLEALRGQDRVVAFDFIHSEDEVLSLCFKVAREGQCVIWVRNTVSEALRAYAALKDRASGDGEVCLRLFHSRFCLHDRQDIERDVLSHFGKTSGPEERQGCLLIATQVVEQSLDLDCDVLITDLAPADLIVQRAGRLHRHTRLADGTLKAAGPDERPQGVCYIHCPVFEEHPDEKTFHDALGGTAYVYPDLDTLWRTQRFLITHRSLSLLRDSRAFLEEALSVSGEARFPKAFSEVQTVQQQMVSKALNACTAVERGFIPRTESVSDTGEFMTTRYGGPQAEVLLLRPYHTPYLPYVEGDRTGILSVVRVPEAWLNRLKRQYPELFVKAEECSFLKHRRTGANPALLMAVPEVYDRVRGLHGGNRESAH